MANQGGQNAPEDNQPNPNDVPREQEVDQPPRPRQARANPAPRRTRLNLGLHLGAPGTAARPVARPPRLIAWPHVPPSIPPSLPLPPVLRPRAPAPPVLPVIMNNCNWKCPVCREGFFNMRALCGHMRIHKNRNWRGIYPPAEICEPSPGMASLGKDLGSNWMFPSSVAVGVDGSSSGGMQAGRAPWVPPINWSANGPLIGAEAGGSERERQITLNLGKRSAPPEEKNGEASRKSKKATEGGPLPDLNRPPPSSNDENEGEGEGDEEGGGSTSAA